MSFMRECAFIFIFYEMSFYFPSSATLLVAVNEIKKSARQNGVSFYEYGVYNSNLVLFLQTT